MSEMTSRKFLSKGEQTELLRTLTLCSKRDRLIVELLMETGCRGAELREIRPSDLDLENGTVRIVGKKRSKTREIPLSEALMYRLTTFIREEGIVESEPILGVSESGLKLIWNRIRPSKKGIHSLRHTFAIELFLKTRDVRIVQLCMGHRSIQSTMVYADYVYSVSEIRKVLQGGLYGA